MTADILQAAKEAIELRKDATSGDWNSVIKTTGPQMNGDHQQTAYVQTDDGRMLIGFSREINKPAANHNSIFIAHAGNHYAVVAQLAIELQAKVEALEETIEQWQDATGMVGVYSDGTEGDPSDIAPAILEKTMENLRRIEEQHAAALDTCMHAPIGELHLAQDGTLASMVRNIIAEWQQTQAKLDDMENSCLAVIKERDSYHDMLDKFVDAVGGADVHGEHSSSNCPWHRALEFIETREWEFEQLQAKLDTLTPEWLAMAEAAIACIEYKYADTDPFMYAEYLKSKKAYLAAKGDHNA